MTVTTIPTEDVDRSSATLHVAKGAGLGAAAAAVAVMAVAAVSTAVDVPLTVDAERIPVEGFAIAVAMSTAVGTLIALALQAWSARPQGRFVAVALVLTAASVLPVLTAGASTATRVVLIVTHLVGAALVIPAIARRLPVSR